MSLAGKIVLLTGASSGLGRALASAFAGAGCRVAAVGRNEAALAALAAELRARGAVVEPFTHDLHRFDGAAELVAQVESRIGPVAILVNNAGAGVSGTVADVPMAEFLGALESNLLGAIALSKAVLPGMLGRKDGALAFVSSGVALRALPGYAPYSAAKAALSAFADSLRVELAGSGISVTTVYPGKLVTPFQRRSRHFGQPFASPGGGALPERIAARILDAVEKRKPFVTVRGAAWLAAWLDMLAPGLVDRVLAARFDNMRRTTRR